MNLKGRVQHLEELTGANRGRCPLCLDWPKQVIRTYRKDPADAEPVPERGHKPVESCPACGYQPTIMEIVHVVVRTREEAVAALRLMKETAEAEEGYL
jgi:hypothetical protein